MYYRVTVHPIDGVIDREERGIILQAQSLGVVRLESVRSQTLYFLRGDLTPEQVDRLCEDLLIDPVTEVAAWEGVDDMAPATSHDGEVWILEVGLHPGVTDPVAKQIAASAATLGFPSLEAATGQRYELRGDLSEADVHTLARRLFCNETIQHYRLGAIIPAFPQTAGGEHRAEEIPLAGLSDDELLALSRGRLLALNLAEMAAIRDYFGAQGRAPTDIELETLAQTWSEHCVHKTFRALVDVTDEDGAARQIDGLLQCTVRAATETVKKPWVRSAFVDNAGIIDFDDEYEISFKVETHNHPSALEPFGGANTGVGGVVRDIIGVSARPIACTDVFCFGPQDLPLEQVPDGSLHPRRVKAGVVSGVEDYGNKLGLPTVSGAILYDESYTANPLVFVGCVGMAPKGSHPVGPQAGDRVVVIGGRTGRDGLHGATFSSESLTHETGEVAGTAVQIGDPIVEKDVMEVVCLARDAGLYSAITDCGAGGLSSAVGELGKELGVDVELAHVPLKYPGLQPWEIWLSEAQERMVLAVPEAHWSALRSICRDWNVELTSIGRFTDTGRLIVRYDDRVVADLHMDFLHGGLPRQRLAATCVPAAPRASARGAAGKAGRPGAEDLSGRVLELLAHPNIASKEDVIRRYDHEVGAGTIIKPLTGAANAGPSDAVVLKPMGTWSHDKGIVLSLGVNPEIGKIDAYAMAVSAIDEAVRNAVAVGADPDQIALLDNFCWGNPRRSDQMGSLVRAAEGCYDGALAYGAPFISGKDSLNNEYVGPDGERKPIPGTLLISALGIIPDVNRAVTMDVKGEGNRIFLLGETGDALAGSHYAQIVPHAGQGGNPPTLPADGLQLYRALHVAMTSGLVRACHDLSEGGLAVAAAEMCIAGRLGMRLDLTRMPADDPSLDAEARLFSESNGRFLVEVAPDDVPAFLGTLGGHPVAEVGIVEGTALVISDGEAGAAMSLDVSELESAWRGGGR